MEKFLQFTVILALCMPDLQNTWCSSTGCEEVLYKNQDWNINNSIRSFGQYIYEYILKENFVCNAGSFVTKFESFKNIAIIDYLMSNNTGVNADQAGFNILLNLFKNEVQIARMSDGWAFQAGGVKNPKDYYTFKDNINLIHKKRLKVECTKELLPKTFLLLTYLIILLIAQ